MPSVDDVLSGPALAGLRRVTRHGGDREVTAVQLAEQFADLDGALAGSFVLLSRATSAAAIDYRLDMALRWAAIHEVAAVAAFSAGQWQPPRTAADIAERAGIALVSVPAETDLSWLLLAIMRHIGGSAERALLRAAYGLEAVTRAAAGPGGPGSTGGLLDAVGRALGLAVTLESATATATGPAQSAAGGVRVPVMTGDTLSGYLTAPDAHGDLAVTVQLVLHAAAAAAGRLLDQARRASELPIRSRSVLLAELLMSETALGKELLDRARQLGVPLDGWHVAIRFEAENLEQAGRDEVQRFELLETAGETVLQAAARTSGGWHLCWIARAVVLVKMTSAEPGPQARLEVARAAERARAAVSDRLPGLRLRGGVGTPHEGPMGLRASAAEARLALASARAAGQPAGVAVHDAAGVQRMLMEWYASDTARASVRAQLEPLERLGPARAETAIRTLGSYLDNQGSIVRTARALHLHRNAVSYRLSRITELLGADLDNPDQRLALQLACRARLLALPAPPGPRARSTTAASTGR